MQILCAVVFSFGAIWFSSSISSLDCSSPWNILISTGNFWQTQKQPQQTLLKIMHLVFNLGSIWRPQLIEPHFGEELVSNHSIVQGAKSAQFHILVPSLSNIFSVININLIPSNSRSKLFNYIFSIIRYEFRLPSAQVLDPIQKAWLAQTVNPFPLSFIFDLLYSNFFLRIEKGNNQIKSRWMNRCMKRQVPI